MSTDSSPWLLVGPTKGNAAVTLFCFGAAGTGGSQFLGWNRLTPPWLNVVGVQLPGREERCREVPSKDVKWLARSVADAIGSSYLGKRCALFGHSFGGLLVFETAHYLQAASLDALGLFIAARGAPHIKWSYPKTYLLPEDEFIQVLKGYGGVDERAIDTRQSRDFFLPVIRSDLEANSEYVHEPSVPLGMSILVARGSDDAYCSDEEIQAWRRLTTGAFTSIECEGGHFFFRHHPRRVLDLIVSALRPFTDGSDYCRTPREAR